MISLLLLAAQSAAPDIELNASLRARSVTVEKRGDAKLAVSTSPEGANLVDVEAPKANGRATVRNVTVNVRAEARIADPLAARNNPQQAETAPPE
jgi:hypothetical protein